MGTVGLRALRREASEIVRRVEGGEAIDITVSGRLAARMVPVRPRQWLRWSDIADCFDGPPDPDWERDRDRIDQSSTACPQEHTFEVIRLALEAQQRATRRGAAR